MRAALPLLLIVTVLLPVVVHADITDATERARSGAFDATGDVRCAQEKGQPLGMCKAGVARAGKSAAAVVVTFSNGFKRTLTFADGKFQRGDATMSGVGTDTDWHRSDGLFHIRVDDQRFELPEALVLGD